MKKLFFPLLAALLFGCTPEVVAPSSQLNAESEGQIFEIEYKAAHKWTSSIDCDWISATPSEGNEGPVVLKLTVQANPSDAIRKGKFVIHDGAADVTYLVVQYASTALGLPKELGCKSNGGEVEFTVNTSKTITVSVNQNWLRVKNINERKVTLEVDPNNTETGRDAIVTVNADAVKAEIPFHQSSNGFTKTVYGVRFTGTWCGWCPGIEMDIRKFDEDHPGKLVSVSYYNDSKNLTSNLQGKFESIYPVDGFPCLFLDNRGKTGNYNSTAKQHNNYNNILSFSNEAQAEYPPLTGISISSSLSGDVVTANVGVAARESGDYHLNVVLVEDGVVASQADYAGFLNNPSQCVHNHVMRTYFTEIPSSGVIGNLISLGVDEVKEFTFTTKIPSQVVNNSNLQIVAYVTSATTTGTKKSATGFQYGKYAKEYVDNCAICPVGESLDIQYN